jgi:glycosyltransferase involved in cell wall biosynthesis
MCLKNSISSKLRLIKNALKFGDLVIVSTPDLLKEIPSSVWIENSINIEEWSYKKKKINNGKIRIIHSPSDRLLKGTYYIEQAVHKLKKLGYNIELILLENIPNTQVKEFMKEADIAIDQLNVGWYGVFGIEAMSMGIPTCSYIKSDLEEYAKKCPIINVNSKNLIEKLQMLIEDGKLREKIGKMSRRFAESHHDYIKNAKKIINLYKSI